MMAQQAIAHWYYHKIGRLLPTSLRLEQPRDYNWVRSDRIETGWAVDVKDAAGYYPGFEIRCLFGAEAAQVKLVRWYCLQREQEFPYADPGFQRRLVRAIWALCRERHHD